MMILFPKPCRIQHLELVLLHSQGYDSKIAGLYKELNKLQYPENCSQAQWAVHPHDPCGLACNVMHLLIGSNLVDSLDAILVNMDVYQQLHTCFSSRSL